MREGRRGGRKEGGKERREQKAGRWGEEGKGWRGDYGNREKQNVKYKWLGKLEA